MKPRLFKLAAALSALLCASTAHAAILSINLVEDASAGTAFPLVAAERAAPLWHDADDYPGVLRAINDLQADIERVTGRRPEIAAARPSSTRPVIIGTLGKSALIDSLVRNGKLDASDLAGKWESFVIATVEQPAPGIEQALVIAGSDKRGTIYGIYELSEQLGVSPWYWWADVPVKKRVEAHVASGRFASGEPAVRYRGIFINDEEPCLGQWARAKFGGINSAMYAHMFELMLRLRANYLWPAMWSSAFGETDPASPRLADEYGIVMGTSHHEPMMRAHQEWTSHKKAYGNGEWNYATNADGLRKFFREGAERTKNFENLVTIGMRGDGDASMVKDGDEAANISLMERIVADQRGILSDVAARDAAKIPQLWALYKEVAGYYESGMKVPDDVTLLWCDDNWGNIRRMPAPGERKRAGGAGVYYHFDYVGSPRSYKWINTNPLPKIWEQMSMAFDYGADRVWIVNVGDLKPMELPIDFFLALAWNPKALPKEKIASFTRAWAARTFGPAHADDIADIVSKYAKYNGWRKPELLEPSTFSLVNHQEAERVLAAWQDIVARAEKINTELPAEYRDAFFQLVLHPAKASATVVELYIETGRNRLYAAQGRASANEHARRVRELFKQDQELTDAYHALGGGKWMHMMKQTHIGYSSWNDPKTDILPELAEVAPASAASLGVAIEGSESSWPGAAGTPKLPAFDALNRQVRWIDVFKRGGTEVAFTAAASQPWIKLSAASGTLEQDRRIWVSIDWDKVPAGSQDGVITVSRPEGETVAIQLAAVRSDKFTRDHVKAFGGLTGPTAIPADAALRNIPAGKVRWELIPDYGRGSAGMSIFPTTAASVLPPADAPRLEYPVLIAHPGDFRVDLVTGPSLNVQPDRGLRVAVSFDDQPPQIVDAFAGQSFDNPAKRGDTSAPAIKDWGQWVRDNAKTLTSTHTIAEAGVHTLKVRMVDPGVVLQKLVVYQGKLPASYFGPPEAALDDTGR